MHSGDGVHLVFESLRHLTAAAVKAAQGADAAAVVVGGMPFISGREDHDRAVRKASRTRGDKGDPLYPGGP